MSTLERASNLKIPRKTPRVNFPRINEKMLSIDTGGLLGQK